VRQICIKNPPHQVVKHVRLLPFAKGVPGIMGMIMAVRN